MGRGRRRREIKEPREQERISLPSFIGHRTLSKSFLHFGSQFPRLSNEYSNIFLPGGGEGRSQNSTVGTNENAVR